MISMIVSSSSERSSCMRTERKGERNVPRLFRAWPPLSPMLGVLLVLHQRSPHLLQPTARLQQQVPQYIDG